MSANSKAYMNEYMYGKNGYMNSQKKKDENASRKRARRALESDGRVKPFDGKEVDHKNSNPNNNSKTNLRVVSRKTNRVKGALKAVSNRKKRANKGGTY